MPGLTSYRERFTPDETRVLGAFFTNTDKPVFYLRNSLDESEKSALVARYSRSTRGMRRLFLDEFTGREKATDPFPPELLQRVGHIEALLGIRSAGRERAHKLHKKVLAGYGDDSVRDSASGTIGIEGVDQLVTKEIENCRLGGEIERSTRYGDFGRKVRVDREGYVLGFSTDGTGSYMYREYPEITASLVGALYVETMDRLFDTFRALQEPVARVYRERFPIGEQSFTVTVNGEERIVRFEQIRTLERVDVEKEEKLATKAYETAIKAKVFDLTRGPFPTSIMTNLGWHASYRSFQHTLVKMFASEFPPAVTVAQGLLDELSSAEGPLIEDVKDSHGTAEIDQIKTRNAGLREIARGLAPALPSEEAEPGMRFVHGDVSRRAEAAIAAASVYQYTSEPFESLEHTTSLDSNGLIEKIIRAGGAGRKNRRHKLPRSFELENFTQETVGNWGVYRDLERNRFTLHIRQPLTTKLGYDMPPAISDAGMEREFKDAMEASDALYSAVLEHVPAYAELATTFAHRLRWISVYDWRQAAHFHAIRTIPEGHPHYRTLMQEGAESLRRESPLLADVSFAFVNTGEHHLERLASAHRTEKKLDALDSKTT